MSCRRRIDRSCAGLVVSLFCGWLTLGYCAPGRLHAQETLDTNQLVDRHLNLLTDDTLVGALVYPRQFFQNPLVQRLPVEVSGADLRSVFGIDVLNVEFAIPFVEHAAGESVSAAVILRWVKPVNWRELPPSLLSRTTYGQLHGKPYRRGLEPHDYSLYLMEPQTLVIALDATLQRMTALRDTEPAVSGVAGRLRAGIGKQLDIHLYGELPWMRPLLSQYVQQAGTSSGAWQAFGQLVQAAERFEVRVRCQGQLAVGIVFEADHEAAIAQLQSVYESWLAALQPVLNDASITPADLAVDAATDHPTKSVDRLSRYFRRATHSALTGTQVRMAGNKLQIGVRGNAADQASTCAAIMLLLKPSWEACRAALVWCQSLDGGPNVSMAGTPGERP